MSPAEGHGSGRKVAKVKAELLRQMEINNFPRGSVLPPERELSKRFGISYMTIRKAISELVSENYLERQQGVGTFVRKDIPASKVNRILGIVCPAWNSPEVSDFVIHASYFAEANGWCPKPHYCRFWEDLAFEDAWNSSDALLIIPLGSFHGIPKELLAKMKSGEKPSAIIGVGAMSFGFDSVLGNEDKAIEMALEKLAARGHERIAFVSQSGAFGDQEVLRPAKINFDAWSRWIVKRLGDDQRESLLIRSETAPYEMEHQSIYSKILGMPKRPPFTAVITPFCLALAVTAALKDKGLSVPEDVSVLAMGDRQEGAYYRPRVSHVKSSLRNHAELAMKAILRRLENRTSPPQSFIVDPEWIEGETTGHVTGRI